MSHSWDFPGTLPKSQARAKTCRNCGVQARRFGHGAGSYWDYTAKDGTFLGTPSQVPTCPPEMPKRISMRCRLDTLSVSEQVKLAECTGCVIQPQDGGAIVLICSEHETDEIFRRLGTFAGGEEL